MTSTTARSTPPDDISHRDESAIDMDALEAGFEEAQAQALHQQDEIRGYDQAEPEPPDIRHALMKDILRNQNYTSDVSKKLLEITGASIVCLLQLAYRSPGSTSPGPLTKVVAVSVCIAHILLLTAMILRELVPRAAKVIEKFGVFAFICWVLLLMWLFIA